MTWRASTARPWYEKLAEVDKERFQVGPLTVYS
jgi:hypothetical protein